MTYYIKQVSKRKYYTREHLLEDNGGIFITLSKDPSFGKRMNAQNYETLEQADTTRDLVQEALWNTTKPRVYVEVIE